MQIMKTFLQRMKSANGFRHKNFSVGCFYLLKILFGGPVRVYLVNSGNQKRYPTQGVKTTFVQPSNFSSKIL